VITYGVPLSPLAPLEKRQAAVSNTLVLLLPVPIDGPVLGTTIDDRSPLPAITISFIHHETITAVKLQSTSFVTETVPRTSSVQPRAQTKLDEKIQISQTHPHYKVDASVRARGPGSMVYHGTRIWPGTTITSSATFPLTAAAHAPGPRFSSAVLDTLDLFAADATSAPIPTANKHNAVASSGTVTAATVVMQHDASEEVDERMQAHRRRMVEARIGRMHG